MLLPAPEISELFLKAVQYGLHQRRSALTAGMDGAYLAGLEQASFPNDQMLLDLRALNVTDRVIGSDIPLKQWLENAALIKGAETDYFSALAEKILARPNPSVKDAEQGARSTLETLQSLAGSSEAFRRLLAAASEQFEAIAGSVKVLMAYKGLHDFLHDIQVFRLPLIQATLPAESAGTNWALLKRFISELEFKLDDAHNEKVSMLKEDSRVRLDEERWLAEFKEICLAFNGAIKDSAADRAGDALVDLRGLIRYNMSRLNLLLYHSASRLGISALIDRLRSFASSLEEKDARRDQLREAATRLFLLHSEIETLLSEHDLWQQIDDKLWSAEDSLLFGGGREFELRSFSRLWPVVVERVTQIAEPTAEWYVRVKQLADSFGANCPLPITLPIALVALDDFREFTSSARNQFYYIDSQLKNRCSRLTQIAEPLEELARTQ